MISRLLRGLSLFVCWASKKHDPSMSKFRDGIWSVSCRNCGYVSRGIKILKESAK